MLKSEKVKGVKLENSQSAVLNCKENSEISENSHLFENKYKNNMVKVYKSVVKKQKV